MAIFLKSLPLFLIFCFLFSCAKYKEEGSFTYGRAKVTNGEIFFEIIGKGKPLVLIHGGNLDRRMWDEQFNLFAKDYKVIRYDVRSFGKSDRPQKPYSNVEDLYALLKFLKVDKATLIGLSMGGGISIDFAITHPEMVNALVLAAPGLSGYNISQEYMQRWWATVEAARDEGFAKANELWLKDPYMAPAMENPKIADKIRKISMDNSEIWLANIFLERPIKPPAIGRISEIKIPTLLILGDRDVADIYNIADTLMAKIPGIEKVVIPGAGHMVNMEKPEEFNKAVMEFLGRH
jgi:pimeloyl-ACP methyl ester carboxylesterase